jgi:hypothetical protein
MKQPQSGDNDLLNCFFGYGQQFIRNNFFWMFGERRLHAATPRNPQLRVDVDDVNAGRDRSLKVMVVCSGTTVQGQEAF